MRLPRISAEVQFGFVMFLIGAVGILSAIFYTEVEGWLKDPEVRKSLLICLGLYLMHKFFSVCDELRHLQKKMDRVIQKTDDISEKLEKK